MDTEAGTCESCPAFSLCTEKDVATSCIGNVYYLKSDKTACVICSNPSANALYCTGLTVANKPDKITQCSLEAGGNRYYKTANGCVSVPTSNNCLTVSADGSECLTCISGYVLDTGVCLECNATNYGVAHDEEIVSCEDGDADTAATPTCGDGYYLNTDNLCEVCAISGGNNSLKLLEIFLYIYLV